MDVLLITGPAGVGKSTVALELSRQLERRDIPHALIDTDELDRTFLVWLLVTLLIVWLWRHR